ncbi:hypothetical protein SDC9_201797 [bioreactor metagenome]|uniref:Uncharacterized protein n=1 Tax=bioreactor metagenome TaxID=1076179 RepID=A0A645IRX4_9ZZZZ
MRNIFDDSLLGEEILQEQQGYCNDAQRDHQYRIPSDIPIEPHRQNDHVDHHADDNTGYQCPGKLTDKFKFCFFFRVTCRDGYDRIPEKIEICAPNRVIANHKSKKVVPVAFPHRVSGE